MTLTSTAHFLLDDFPRTLFPLQTSRFLVEHGVTELQEYIRRCLDPAQPAYSFLSQRRVYAAKPSLHLRRTIKLDPVSEYYLYDLVYRNRKRFREPHSPQRDHFGYRFKAGAPISATSAYAAFKAAISQYRRRYRYFISFDIASYFNSIYHHDIVAWLAELGASNADVEGLGQLLREANTGRSVDCLPQGLYPAKMIGSDFLKFVDNHGSLRASHLVRFMDDFYLFSNDQNVLQQDFMRVQKLLGDKGLSVNPSKTRMTEPGPSQLDAEVDEVKKQLLNRRRFNVSEGYGDDATERVITVKRPLSDQELSYINELLSHDSLEEEDAELVLAVMREHAEKVEARIPSIIADFPHLAKNIYGFCASIPDKEALTKTVLKFLSTADHIQEYQLFWFGVMLEEYLISTHSGGSLVNALLDHRDATVISKAKVLEIADSRFGLTERRDQNISGQSDWLAWSSAVGHRALTPISRNHKLAYFAKSSPMNNLIHKVVSEYRAP